MKSDQWLRRCRKMWTNVGNALAEVSLEQAKLGNHRTSVDLARAAEACWWQATGDGEASYLKPKEI